MNPKTTAERVTGTAEVLRAVLADGARRTVRVSRRFAGTPAQVWPALVQPERIARWFADVDLADDGAFVLTFSAQDDSQIHGRVLECEADRRLLVNLRWDDGTDGEVEVTLVAAGEGTDLVLEHRGLPAISAPEYGSGWEAHLELLTSELPRGADWTGTAPPAAPTGFDELVPTYRSLEAAAVAGAVPPGPLGRGRPGDGAGVRLDRVLEAGVDEVWAACTRPARLSQWMWPVLEWPGGLDVDPPRTLAAGDRIVFGDTNVPDGRMCFDVLELDAPRELLVLWGPEGAADADRTEVWFTLEDRGGATLLTIRQGPAPEIVAAGRLRGGADFAAGWHSLVDVLAARLSGAASPDPEELWEAAYTVYAAGATS
ncbi:SRPBCC domain-containing protein [Pengzhenrongella sp.]|jgi:uncharacterized protein YndB with AHSA1/START domain|uniref:SRPBCC domain-containing protein n=1 Tax=Pengzhenrongella sp. TaxID=2888820 RepID=UPI002F93ACB5